MLESRDGYGDGRRILLVEDDPAARNMIARHLKRSGFMVTAVESAEIILLEGLDPVFDVVVSDVHLPGMSGIELAGTLLSRRPMQPIVLVTGDPDEALAREALSRGPVSYLLKPFELFDLDAAVRQALARVRQDTPDPARRTSWTGRPPLGGAIPEGWLEFVDEQSYAGPEHGARVARIGVALLRCLPEAALEITAAELGMAARTHEIGRVVGATADPVECAVAGARLLADAGFPAVIVRAVRHLHERWDGTGGPDGYAGARIPAASLVVATADSLDHYCAAWIQAGMKPLDAVDRAIGLVTVQHSGAFSPLVCGAVHRERVAIREICGVARPSGNERSSSPLAMRMGRPGLKLA